MVFFCILEQCELSLMESERYWICLFKFKILLKTGGWKSSNKPYIHVLSLYNPPPHASTRFHPRKYVVNSEGLPVMSINLFWLESLQENRDSVCPVERFNTTSAQSLMLLPPFFGSLPSFSLSSAILVVITGSEEKIAPFRRSNNRVYGTFLEKITMYPFVCSFTQFFLF